MNGRSESPAQTHLVERQMLLSRVRAQQVTRPAYIESGAPFRFITIARDVGSQGDTVASELAQRLDWHLFDKEIVDSIAQDSHVRQNLVHELDERSQSLIHDTVQRLLFMAQGISFGNEEYHEALLRTLAYLATRGRAVIVGRGSAFALQGEPGFHVRVIASPEVRAAFLARSWLLSPAEARRRMQLIDGQRRSFIHHHYRQNLDDPHFYDLICNTDRMSVEQIVHAIMGMMAAPKADRYATAAAGAESATRKATDAPRFEAPRVAG
jgi:cytidylate kinase